jgi:hypothetical protein
MSLLVTRETAQEAIKRVRPAVEALIKSGVLEGSNLHIVCLDPDVSPGDWDEIDDDSVLYEESFGNVESWPYDYRTIARAKANLAWRCQKSSREVHALQPFRLRAEDTIYGTGAVYLHGIVVATSGVQSDYDEMISYWVASAINALAHQNRAEFDPAGDFFIEKPEFRITQPEEDGDSQEQEQIL